MSLRSKIVLILVTVVVGYAALDNGLLRAFAGHAFGRWEREGAEERLGRVRKRLDSELEDLIGKGRLLAGTSAMRGFARGDGADFIRQDLGAAALERAGVDLFYVCDPKGTVLWGSILDPRTREPIRVPEFPREALSPSNPAIVFREGETCVSGVLTTRAHPLLFSTVPIPGADGELFERPAEDGADSARYLVPAHGALVLGRFLGPDLKQRIAKEELAFSSGEDMESPMLVELLESGAAEVPPEIARADNERLLVDGADGLLHAYERIGTLRTNEPFVLHVALDRGIDAHRKLSVNYALLSSLIGGLLILLVLLRLLQSIVVAPLSTLTRKAVEIGRLDDTTIRVGLERPDEIGQLAGEFDRMLEKLATSRAEVVRTARLAGRSEIATGVLHNVGNVLNSVNVAANLATRKTEEFSIQDLEMLVGVLASHESDLGTFVSQDPRGKHLIPFLKELTGALATQRGAIQDELKALNQGIDHIAELVRAQQSHAGAKGVFEMAALDEQVEGALSICKQGLDAHGIEVERDFEPLPSVRVDKHKLMEILVNLIQNAGQAMAERGGPGLKLHLGIRRHAEGTARVEVRDNGIGIDPAILARVFNHGFTTKKDGHGFGLHVSANAATEMGAKLHAASAGTGHGASFFLDLPMQPETAQVAA